MTDEMMTLRSLVEKTEVGLDVKARAVVGDDSGGGAVVHEEARREELRVGR